MRGRIERSNLLKSSVENGDRLIRYLRRSLDIKTYRCVLKVARDPIAPRHIDATILREVSQEPLNLATDINDLAERRTLSTFVQYQPDT